MGITVNRKLFFTHYRAEFGAPTQSQVAGLNALLDGLQNDPDINDICWGAYMLATVKHECANKYHPIEEFGKGKGKKYGKPVNGHVYFGRGYVQLTWDFNYERLGNALHVDLLNNPELALDPDIAYKVMSYGMRKGTFTGHRLSEYFTATKTDRKNARKIINGLDKAALIAGYAEQFEKILEKSPISEAASRLPSELLPVEEVPTDTSADSSNSQPPTLNASMEIKDGAVKMATSNTIETLPPVDIAPAQPYEGVGLLAKLKSDGKWILGGNTPFQLLDTYNDKIQQYTSLIPPGLISKLAIGALLVGVVWLIFRLVHYTAWQYKEKARIKLEAEHADPMKPTINWVEPK